ncbi:MAG: hypothetical protein V4604_01190 [Bacteroidota bacterium]
MKKTAITFFALLFLINVSATSLYDQLCAFNFNWKNHKTEAPESVAQVFTSDKEYIQAHLSSVLTILRANPGIDLSQEQFRSRMHLIGLLDGYRLAGNFPINYYRNERIPVFIDEHNTHCAVGYLMQQTGYETMARRISTTDNYVWVKDIKDTEVPAWQVTSGFSMDELKLIQGAYDSYMYDAINLPNRYEVPQKPECMTAYFEEPNVAPEKRTKWKVWLNGEGENGILHGRWEQNYSAELPWITGHYTHGKRSGKWEEYYQGTTQLCRTEFWDNDKLNGIRTRFDRHNGTIIEEILFKDGHAVTKTNYEFGSGLKYVRTPIDSTLVWTDIYNVQGELLASGKEKIHNPGNLQWFQNIELTALNSFSLSSQSMNVVGNNGGNDDLGYQGVDLYAAPPLVEYKKEGEWMYYTNHNVLNYYQLRNDYYSALYYAFGMDLDRTVTYDSIRMDYANNQLQHFYGYGATDFVHLFVEFHDPKPPVVVDNLQFGDQIQFQLQSGPRFGRGYRHFEPLPVIKTTGKYNECGQKIGEWKHFDEKGILYKLETYLVPRDEEETAAR